MNINVWAASLCGGFEGTLAPVSQLHQCRLDMLAGTQAIDTVIRAVAAVAWLCQRANLYPVALLIFGLDPIEAEKLILRGQGFDLEYFRRSAPAAAFDLIGITGGPARWKSKFFLVPDAFRCF